MTNEQLEIIAKITIKLADLGHEVKFTEPINVGPLVTTFRFQPKGIAKVSQITSLSQDLALVLGVEDLIVRRIPGEAVIGITVPNKQRTIPMWRDSFQYGKTSWADVAKIPLNLGVTSLGNQFADDLVLCPHLLIAGSTGSGKSTLLASIIATIVYQVNSHDVQFILSDTKNVEFGYFVGAPHLLFDPCTTKYQTLEKLDWLYEEIERRLKIIGAAGERNILDYNKKHSKMSHIVLVIDELADILSVGGERGEAKIAEAKLSRIVQKSRAAGVHVIAATQRPSVNIVSGSIKANFPARLSFRLPSEADSRTVLGQAGAEHLLSRGDMLYQSSTRPNVIRLHSAYASIEDLRGAVESVRMRHQMELNK